MNIIKPIKEKEDTIYPITNTRAVYDDEGNRLDETLEGLKTNGAVKFDSADVGPDGTPTMQDVPKMVSGETPPSLWHKVSQFFTNVRYLIKMLGTTDISSIGDGTVTGAISNLSSNKISEETEASLHSVHLTGRNATMPYIYTNSAENILFRYKDASGNMAFENLADGPSKVKKFEHYESFGDVPDSGKSCLRAYTVIQTAKDSESPIPNGTGPFWFDVIDTQFGENTRRVQIATQVYNVGGISNSYNNRMWRRTKHDSSWSQWKEISSGVGYNANNNMQILDPSVKRINSNADFLALLSTSADIRRPVMFTLWSAISYFPTSSEYGSGLIIPGLDGNNFSIFYSSNGKSLMGFVSRSSKTIKWRILNSAISDTTISI